MPVRQRQRDEGYLLSSDTVRYLRVIYLLCYENTVTSETDTTYFEANKKLGNWLLLKTV